ncbi:fasciclin domain-containing protein [Pontibacter silvestris]|uniref:Fasciclin domain-containing protein n=1 Tax=Pontibacter silvestris TaxID=2305183 RepID=A0ABW4WT46_9BACT|nr:fasciclin domain-containing protein [Pontibacter silvestris]MCC9138053.1 fasciclin domain-containing protein [Pontibacter silvestris]
MKKIMLKPIAAMTVVAFTMFSCASSNENMDNSTAMDRTTMSETQAMAGDTDMGTSTNTSTGMSSNTSANMNSSTSSSTVDYGAMFDDIENTEQYDVLTLARTNPNLSTFVDLVEKTGMDAALRQNDQQFTLFIPTNEAFQNLSKERYAFLMDPNNKAELMKVLQAHFLPSKVSSMEFNSTQRIESGDKYIPVDVNMNGTSVSVGGATIVKSDVETSNGIIHIVDSVIDPDNFDDTTIRY